MVVNRQTGTSEDRQAVDLPHYLAPPDRAFINKAQPMPTRLVGVKEGNGGPLAPMPEAGQPFLRYPPRGFRYCLYAVLTIPRRDEHW